MAKPKNDAKTKLALRISAKTDNFRRAGLAFTRTPIDMPMDDLTQAQIAALKAEPMLVVAEVEIVAAAEESE